MSKDNPEYFEIKPQGCDEPVGRIIINGDSGYLQLIGVPQVFEVSRHEAGETWSKVEKRQ